MDRETWTAVVEGLPVGKGRPRATTRGGVVRTYTPPRTRAWEKAAAAAFRLRWAREPLGCPVRLYVVALFPRPARLQWKRRAMLREPHTGRPDGDNILKACMDSIESAGVVRRDSCIYYAEISKWYASGSESAGVHVRICWSDPPCSL